MEKKLYPVLSRCGKNKEVAKEPFASAIYLFYIMNIRESDTKTQLFKGSFKVFSFISYQ